MTIVELDEQEKRNRLDLVRSLVIGGHVDYSAKVRSAAASGDLATDDLVTCVDRAPKIAKVEQDGKALDFCKYTIIGKVRKGLRLYICGKILIDAEGHRLFFVITAHEADA